MMAYKNSIEFRNYFVVLLSALFGWACSAHDAHFWQQYSYAPASQPSVAVAGASNPRAGSQTSSFQVIHEWKFLDFEYPTYEQRKRAIANREYIPENNLPLGIDVYEKRIFVTTPRWKDGVPASLGYIDYPNLETSPAIRPYPNWASHGDPYRPDCSKIISVYRTSIDVCGRLWAIDSGIVNATVSLNQICPPKILAFDLHNNDELVVSYELPPDQVKQESLHSNILADVSPHNCADAHVYVTDVWRFGVVVYSLAKNRSWRATNYNFSPNPLAADFNVYGLNFQWLDGVFGMSLSCPQLAAHEYGGHGVQQCNLYFHPMASFKEFMVSTSLLRDESLWPARAQEVAQHFVEIGDRGPNGQSSTSGIARNGVMFFTQVHRDSVACWDTAKPYLRDNIALFSANDTVLIEFPNDLKVDKEQSRQGVWVINNRLPIYLYGQLDYSQINFRISRAYVEELVEGTVCDPQLAGSTSARSSTLQEGQCF